jgi:hypothetical protein
MDHNGDPLTVEGLAKGIEIGDVDLVENEIRRRLGKLAKPRLL